MGTFGDTLANGLKGFSDSFLYLFSIAQRFSNTLWEFLEEGNILEMLTT
jgi:hypothetical protein